MSFRLSAQLSAHALDVLERRFLLRDERGVLMEDADGLFRRVARAVAAVDDRYPGFTSGASEERFLELMTTLSFLPNSPTLMNAGTPRGQLAGCFVLPVEDSMESIYATLRDAALIQKSGGGTGFSFSRLRPKRDYVRSTRGQSSGPVSFMRLFDYSTQVNRLGGTRAGANMGVLRCDHPDIQEFVDAKRSREGLTSFNISVLATDRFMRAAERREDMALWYGDEGTPGYARGSINAASLFESIARNAWASGDPGLLFEDRINAANPTPALGRIEATNPCGEQPLLPYESCTLGSINLSRFVRHGAVDYDRLRVTISQAVHFLDNVLDANFYPVEAIRRATLGNRKIGLGVMGFADLLVQLGVPYASEDAVRLAEDLMLFVEEEADRASRHLAAARGAFPNFLQSRAAALGDPPRRNAAVTSIAPTGTISILADCSTGIEPFFALSYRREVIGKTLVVDVRPSLGDAIAAHVPRPLGILDEVRRAGRIGATDVPPRVKALFATAHEIAPEWHVKIQAAFQRHTDTAVSKTINLPATATADDIAAIYRQAFESGCKGVTVFRDGCTGEQVMRSGTSTIGGEGCPECGNGLTAESGCLTCGACGYSLCTI